MVNKGDFFMTHSTDSDISDDGQDRQTAQYMEMQSFARGNLRRHASHSQLTVQPHAVTLLDPAASRLSFDSIRSTREGPNTTNVFIYSPSVKHKKKKHVSLDANKDFIEKFNNNRGNAEYTKQARYMLKQNRYLGGLETPPPEKHITIDVPSARKNFALLASLDDLELKMAALNNLLLLLKNDQLKQETAFDLVGLGINLMKQMDRELMQTQLVDVQLKICKIYGVVTELIQRHYGKKHIGGITKELKEQLIKTAKTLEDLNTHSDPQLHFMVEYALEGVKRLRDDRKELFEIFERVFQGIVALGKLYDEDIAGFCKHLKKAFKNLNPTHKHSWYESAMIFNQLAKKADHDPAKMIMLQSYLNDMSKKSNWKFLYNAILKLTELSIHSSNMKVRNAAFSGQKLFSEEFPGLTSFVNTTSFRRRLNLEPLIHLKSPNLKNHNIDLREISIRSLAKIAKEAPDPVIRAKARIALLQQFKEEKQSELLTLLHDFIPETPDQQEAWKKETGAFAYTPEKLSDIDSEFNPEEDPVDKIAEHIFSCPHYGSQLAIANGCMDPPQVIIYTPKSSPRSSPSTPRVESHPPSPIMVHLQPSHPSTLSKCLGIELKLPVQDIDQIIAVDHEHLYLHAKGMAQLIAIIQKNPQISEINLRDCKIDPDAVEMFLDFLKGSKITKLHINARLTTDQIIHLAAIMSSRPGLELMALSASDAYNLANELNKMEAYERSIGLLLRALSLEGIPLKLQVKMEYKLALAYWKTDHKEKAIAHLKTVFELDHSHYNAAVDLSKIFLAAGKKEEAHLWAKNALTLKPESEKIRALVAKTQ